MLSDVILGVYGLPGSGKTTLMTALATASLSGRTMLGVPPKPRVFSNVPIPGCYELELWMIGSVDLSHALILIDEACQWFDSRAYKTMPKEFSNFFQTIRHEHSSIVMFYQAFNDVDIRFRSLCSRHCLLQAAPFGLTLVQPIYHKQRIYNYKPDDRYVYAPLVEWQLLRRSRYYHLFDSYLSYVDYKPVELTMYPGVNDLVKPTLFARLRDTIIKLASGRGARGVPPRKPPADFAQ